MYVSAFVNVSCTLGIKLCSLHRTDRIEFTVRRFAATCLHTVARVVQLPVTHNHTQSFGIRQPTVGGLPELGK